jgi:hypothetical protein
MKRNKRTKMIGILLDRDLKDWIWKMSQNRRCSMSTIFMECLYEKYENEFIKKGLISSGYIKGDKNDE